MVLLTLYLYAFYFFFSPHLETCPTGETQSHKMSAYDKYKYHPDGNLHVVLNLGFSHLSFGIQIIFKESTNERPQLIAA